MCMGEGVLERLAAASGTGQVCGSGTVPEMPVIKTVQRPLQIGLQLLVDLQSLWPGLRESTSLER